MKNINSKSNEIRTSFVIQLFTGIKENFKNRLASSIVIVTTAVISIAITYVGGALAFQYRAADEIFSIKAEVQDVKQEQKRVADNLVVELGSNTDTLKELKINNDNLEKRIDRMETKIDQLLLR